MYIHRWDIAPARMFLVLKLMLYCAIIAGDGSLDGRKSIHSWVLFQLIWKWSWWETKFENGSRTIPREI
jgi:hypothetical protein